MSESEGSRKNLEERPSVGKWSFHVSPDDLVVWRLFDLEKLAKVREVGPNYVVLVWPLQPNETPLRLYEGQVRKYLTLLKKE